jgi:hypothetical protein
MSLVNPILSYGLLIGAMCSAWIYVMGFSGWYKDPTMLSLFVPVVSAMEVAGLILGLRRTAAAGRSYSGQVVAGTLMALVGGAVIFGASMLFTTIAFPTYFDEINETARTVMKAGNVPDAEIDARIRESAAWQTPVMNAFAGFLGTFVTGVVASAVIAVWVRRKDTSAPDYRRVDLG